jgi:hypothetical protein
MNLGLYIHVDMYGCGCVYVWEDRSRERRSCFSVISHSLRFSMIIKYIISFQCLFTWFYQFVSNTLRNKDIIQVSHYVGLHTSGLLTLFTRPLSTNSSIRRIIRNS